jgi:SIR2-like domain
LKNEWNTWHYCKDHPVTVLPQKSITGNYRYLPFDRSNRFFRELTARIVHAPSAIIPFVGAGLSHYGVGDAKLPLWRQLVERMNAYANDLGVLDKALTARIEYLLRDGAFIAATDILVDAIGPTLFRSFVRQELDVKQKTLSPAAVTLVVIAWSLIVTTNLDETLEEAIQLKYSRRPPIVTNRQIPELIDAVNNAHASDAMTLAKIHGTLDDFASWCLTEKHYQRLLQRPDYQEILRSLFLKRLFFIGFGLVDRDFDLVGDYLSRIFPDGDVDCYALVPDTMKGASRLTSLVKARGLKPIYYRVAATVDPSDPWGGHVEMYECLTVLADAWASSQAKIRVSLKHFAELETTFVGRADEMKVVDHIIFERNRSVQIVGFGGEGKTSFAQEWVRTRTHDLHRRNFKFVYGFSFYSGSVDRFINDCFLDLSPNQSSWDVARRLRFICDEASLRRILFLLDGVEVLLDRNGHITNPYLLEFVERIERTDSRIIFTSRIEVPGPFIVLPMGPLDSDEIETLFKESQRPRLHPATLNAIKERARGHALSVRLSLAMAERESELDEQPWEVDGATDALTANKLERTLRFYESIISPEEHAFLKCFSAFERPTRYGLIERIFLSEIPDFDLNAPLRRLDLRTVVRSLLDKRLLIVSAGTQITAHPNVRDYFRQRAGSLAPLHALIARILMSDTMHLEVVTLADADVPLDICHHAAGAGLWTEFHHVYDGQLMRGHLDYLCDNLGAWSETLAVTSKVFPGGNPARTPTFEPEYYTSHYARCLKHLGFAADAISAYERSLALCAASEHPESALYTNNFLTLQVYAGNLDTAKRLAGWNLALLTWIKDDWKRHWQVEHGGYSIAWLAMILGDLATARQLFHVGETAWQAAEVEPVEIFDHFPLYLVELFLNEARPDVIQAETTLQKYLERGERNNWPETIIRAHIARSVIERFKATQSSQPSPDTCLDRARDACGRAAEAAKSIFAPPVEVELQIEHLRVSLLNPSAESDFDGIEYRLAALRSAVERLGWALYRPELLSLQGLACHNAGNLEKARAYLLQAQTHAERHRNRLAAFGVSQSLPVLRMRLGAAATDGFAAYSGAYAEIAKLDYPRPTGSRFAESIRNGFILQPAVRDTTPP